MPAKKGGRRRGWGWIRRLPSRRFQASYVGPDVIRHTAPLTFTLKSDAEHWLAAERRLIERGEWAPPAQRAAQRRTTGLTLAEYADTWLAHRDVKPRTKGHYRGILSRHLRELGRVPIRDITPEKVRSWHASTSVDKPTMRAHAYRLLHAILATAVTDGLISTNPCHIPKASSARRKTVPVILDVDEVGQLAEVIEERYKALILISAWCGLRWGEVTELRRKDIAAGAEVITVARGVTHRGDCRIDTPKSGKVRTVVVPPHIRQAILDHLASYTGKDQQALLFPAPRGGCHLKDRTFAHHLRPALEKIGRQGMRIHDLRHFAGTQAARVGNLTEIMERLGHSTVSASLLYQHRVSGRDAAVAEALSQLTQKNTAATR